MSVTAAPLEVLARVYINDNFVISNVNIIQGNKGLFVTMPSYKTKQVDENGKDIYRDICYPVTKAFREALYKAIIEEYGNRKDKSEEDFAEYIEQQKIESVGSEGKTAPTGKDGKGGSGTGSGSDAAGDGGLIDDSSEPPFHL
jgi:Uncharacterized protein, involved in the regulation of septum location